MIKIISLFVCLFASCQLLAADKILRVNDFSDPNASYAIKMLKLAIAHSDNPNYQLEISHENFTQTRTNEEVRSKGLLDVCWASSDSDIEAQLRPIRIPLFKGLLGYRIFIINKNDQAKFSHVKTLEELKKLTIGQGRTWADGRILEANGFNVIKTNKYPSLFYMVEGGRFDAFPRGVNEPFGELETRPNMELAVEKSLMLYYRMPFYLFVAPDNQSLAKDLETGFARAIANGEFDKVFYGDKAIQDVMQKANMKNRKLFKLDNPLLSKETPVDRPELWFDPQTLSDADQQTAAADLNTSAANNN
ncbi:diguanylate cyclase [Cellvibrio sp. KY-GH-1]|uniref:diguanylate cyclase n=1 Tax=Cellvibrio sp. KY-GH-1 TaxID=2303332 RepID=UPI00177E5A68|nr:diguanylate cyclase [Cellvibrio sp. KY-GH-1]